MIERDKFLFMFFPPRLRKEEDLFRPKRDKHFLSIFVVPWIVSTYIRDRQRESRVAQRRGGKPFCRFGNRSAEKKEKREGKKAKKKGREVFLRARRIALPVFFFPPLF